LLKNKINYNFFSLLYIKFKISKIIDWLFMYIIKGKYLIY